jgi:deoxyribose-phosphate aldolase
MSILIDYFCFGITLSKVKQFDLFKKSHLSLYLLIPSLLFTLGDKMEQKELIASTIEQTCLKPFATSSDIHKICQEALEWNFFGVCFAPIWLKEARAYIGSASTRLITVAGFPTGAISTSCKCNEIEEALHEGAHEIDFVLNIGWLKERCFQAIEEEFKQLVALSYPTPLKVIIETCYLTDFEKEWASQAAVSSGVTFVKTSTGFGTAGATIEDVRLLRQWAPLVKASGGIKDAKTALALLEAGACRLGTSSGVVIMKELPPKG